MDTRRITELRPHPQNQVIYGDHADADLVESVRTHGILIPLLISKDGTVISGHRRLDAASKIGLRAVPVLCFDGDDLAVLRALVESNRNRQKTNEQIVREYSMLLEVESKEAARRQSTLNNIRHDSLPQHVAEASLHDQRPAATLFRPPTPSPAKGEARQKAAAAVGVSHTTAAKGVEVVKAIDTLEANGHKREAQSLRTTLNQSVGRAHFAARESGQITPQVQAASAPAAVPESGYVTLDAWKALDEAGKWSVLNRPHNPKFHFNKQQTQNIEWAQWSWNPVSGCLHDCSFCYARDIANRLYPQKFQPTFLPDRLGGPANTQVPAEAKTDIGYKNVFTCSMADLFGRWVPSEWIEAVLAQVRANPQWNFLFLTKFPLRMAEFEYPDNAWLGTSVDAQARIPNAEKAMAKVNASVKWLSCEPMLERLTFTSLKQFSWVVIGGASESTQTPEFKPPREWIEHLEQQSHSAGCFVYEKTNLLERIREYPGQPDPVAVNVPAAFKMKYLQRDIQVAS